MPRTWTLPSEFLQSDQQSLKLSIAAILLNLFLVKFRKDIGVKCTFSLTHIQRLSVV